MRLGPSSATLRATAAHLDCDGLTRLQCEVPIGRSNRGRPHSSGVASRSATARTVNEAPQRVSEERAASPNCRQVKKRMVKNHLKTLAESRGNAMVKLLRRTTEWHAKSRPEPSGASSAKPSCRRPSFTASPSPAEGLMAARRASGPTWRAINATLKWTRRSWSSALLSASLFLTACTTTPEPKIVVRTVNVPVAIECAAQLNTEPTYSDTPESLRAAPDIFERTKLLLAGRAQRNARITELTAAISGCVG